MKKLEKLTLRELQNDVAVMSYDENVNLIGGCGSFIAMSGGVIVNYDGYCVYYSGATVSPDGTSVSYAPGSESTVFDGVNASEQSVFQPCDTAYQFNGTIHLGSCANWDLDDYAHEYGHYLQEQECGTLWYLKNVAIPSMETVNQPDHDQQWYEVDATNRGRIYVGMQHNN
jgi:hypothetical protein